MASPGRRAEDLLGVGAIRLTVDDERDAQSFRDRQIDTQKLIDDQTKLEPKD